MHALEPLLARLRTLTALELASWTSVSADRAECCVGDDVIAFEFVHPTIADAPSLSDALRVTAAHVDTVCFAGSCQYEQAAELVAFGVPARAAWRATCRERLEALCERLDAADRRPSTEYDEVFLVAGDVRVAVSAFLVALRARWPGLEVKHGHPRGDLERSKPGELPALEALPAPAGLLLVCRDRDMWEHWQESGGAAMGDGDAPVSLLYGAVEDRVREVRMGEHADPPGSTVRLSVAGLCELTLTVAEAPARSAFTRWAIAAMDRSALTSSTRLAPEGRDGAPGRAAVPGPGSEVE